MQAEFDRCMGAVPGLAMPVYIAAGRHGAREPQISVYNVP
jgi:hypothetical protein